jgi:TfoX/Sxy family transcriptional regulator of competence genes
MPRAKTLITGPYPTPEEVGKIFGMSDAEIRHAVARAERVMAEIDAEAAEKAARKRAARNAARRKQRALLKEPVRTR